MTKTVLITSFHAHVSRNLLATQFLELLKAASNFRVVILAPDYKLSYFRENFSGGNISVEGVNSNKISRRPLGLLFKKLGVFLYDSDTTRLKLKFKLLQDRKLFYFLFFSGAAFWGRSFFVRKLFRGLDFYFSPKGSFNALVQKYRPSLVFSTDIQNENDVALLQTAQRVGIPTLGMVRSWDNMTQRVFRIFPDRLLVGSDEIYKEVIRGHRYPQNKVSIVGQPHYDKYLRAPLSGKKDFFAKFGLDQNRPLILYAPIGDDILSRNDIDSYVIRLLGSLDAQVLVRLPTNLNLNLQGVEIPKNIVFDRPGVGFGKAGALDQEITCDDDERLIDALYYSDVVVAGPTSICLDAALLDRPVVAVNFTPTPRPDLEGLYHYGYVHIKKLMATGGVCEAKSPDKLFSAIETYFKNPALDAEGRANIRKLWFSHADGKASRRLADEVLRLV